MIAALFVETAGTYSGLPDVDPWDEPRDARQYAGPHPVIAHPPCQRWGRFWHGSTRKPHQFKLGDDGGCFAAALAAVRRWGGILEHPADSHAWAAFNLNAPPREGGWIAADFEGGWTCCVSQGHYGHFAGKRTWLYAHGIALPDLRWGPCEQRLHPKALAKYGYEKARRIGMMAMVGGKDKTKIRNGTPDAFRDLLISMARGGQVVKPEVIHLFARLAIRLFPDERGNFTIRRMVEDTACGQWDKESTGVPGAVTCKACKKTVFFTTYQQMVKGELHKWKIDPSRVISAKRRKS